MQNLAGTSDDRTLSFSHNPAGQITSRTDSNTGYAWTDFVNFDETTSYNGLNQMLSVTGQSSAPQYDGRGNMTRDHQGQTYEYDHYNRLSGVGTSIDLAYDPAGRLQETSGTGITFREMQYDGLDLIAEYNGSGTLTARYVHGPGADEPLVQYAGSAVSTRQWLLADERGSIVAVTDWSGAAIQINSYDEYGAPAPGNAGRFGYTGQVWLPETGLYHYKNRAYHPELGRFMQTDPIGVSGGMNLYAYVGGDPVNYTDPLGLRQEDDDEDDDEPPSDVIIIIGFPWPGGGGGFCCFTGGGGGSRTPLGPPAIDSEIETIVVEGQMQQRDPYGYFSWGDTGYHETDDTITVWGVFRPCGFACSGAVNDESWDYFWIATGLSGAVRGGLASGGGLVDDTIKVVGQRLFARGQGAARGWLNRGDFMRVGYGWEGSAKSGRDVFRIVIGSKRGLPVGRWRLPIHWHVISWGI